MKPRTFWLLLAAIVLAVAGAVVFLMATNEPTIIEMNAVPK
jgi:hypothetical protein